MWGGAIIVWKAQGAEVDTRHRHHRVREGERSFEGLRDAYGELSAWVAKPRPIATVLLVIVVLVLLVGAGRYLDAQARDMIAMATAVAGLVTVMVGLMLACDAGQLLYDRERRDAGRHAAIVNVAIDLRRAHAQAATAASLRTATAGSGSDDEAGLAADEDAGAGDAGAGDDAAGAGGGQAGGGGSSPLGFVAPINLNTLLPQLITRIAGLAIALVLLGMIMLVGASALAPASSTSASPTPAGEISPGSVE